LNLAHVVILVVGSATWAQTKKAGKPTAEALTKAWDEDVGSIDLVSKFIEPVQHKPSAGMSPSLPSFRIIGHMVFRI